jgi:hypothetical protein
MLYTALQEDQKLAITVYPNPATEFITLQANSKNQFPLPSQIF